MSKIIIKILCVICIIIVLLFAFIKVNTNIYIGDYSWNCCKIDIQLKIDNYLIVDDSIACNPGLPYHFKKKLRYGFHKINIFSNKANISQEQKIFLLPNQFIHLEFFSADTLFLKERTKKDNDLDLSKNDSVNNENLLRYIAAEDNIRNEKSVFIIENKFNPFYLE